MAHGPGKSLTECPICLEVCEDPRSLPCLHTFCFKCVKRHYGDRCPGDEVWCPVCRQDHPIPDKGAEGLQRNFFVQTLIDGATSGLKKSAVNPAGSDTKCEGCGDDTGNKAVVYCQQCEEKLCETCKKRCLRNKYEIHVIVTLEEEVSYSMQRGSYCEQHNKLLKMFCTECKINTCDVCFAVKHRLHNGLEINDVAKQLSVQIQNGLRRLATTKADIETEILVVEKVKREFVAKANKVQMQIKKNGEQLKKLIDGRVEKLVQEVQDTKQKTEKEIVTYADKLDLELVSVDTFMNYARELIAKGMPCDITRSAKDVLSRVAVLEGALAHNEPCSAPELTFEPVDFSSVLAKVGGWDQFFGDITLKETVGERPSLRSSLRADGVTGVASCDNKLFVVTQERDAILVYRADNGKQLSEIKIPDFSIDFNVIIDIVVCNESNYLYVGQSDMGYSARESEIVWRASVDGNIQKWLPTLPFSQVSLSVKSDRLLIICETNYSNNNNNSSSNKLVIYGANARELKCISPMGITKLHHAVETPFETLIVCHSKPQPQVSEIDFSGRVIRVYNGSRQLNFPRYLALDSDGRVFVADYDSDCILSLNKRLELEGVLLDKNEHRLSDHPVNMCYEKQSRSDRMIVGSCWSACVQVYEIPKSTELAECTSGIYHELPKCSGQSDCTDKYAPYDVLPTSSAMNIQPTPPPLRQLPLPESECTYRSLGELEKSSTVDEERYPEDDYDPYAVISRAGYDDCQEAVSRQPSTSTTSTSPAEKSPVGAINEDNPRPIKQKFRLNHLFARRPKKPK